VAALVVIKVVVSQSSAHSQRLADDESLEFFLSQQVGEETCCDCPSRSLVTARRMAHLRFTASNVSCLGAEGLSVGE
jgi:hypothetical protein